MSEEQDKFDRILGKVEEALDGEEVMYSIGILMNWIVVHGTNHFGNVADSYYTVDKLKHQYFEEISKALSLAKKSSPTEK
jgi:hypothetical protein